MQLDADEDGDPFFKPPPVSMAPIPRSGEAQPQVGPQQHQQEGAPRDSEETLDPSEAETSQAAAAATTTVEQDK